MRSLLGASTRAFSHGGRAHSNKKAEAPRAGGQPPVPSSTAYVVAKAPPAGFGNTSLRNTSTTHALTPGSRMGATARARRHASGSGGAAVHVAGPSLTVPVARQPRSARAPRRRARRSRRRARLVALLHLAPARAHDPLERRGRKLPRHCPPAGRSAPRRGGGSISPRSISSSRAAARGVGRGLALHRREGAGARGDRGEPRGGVGRELVERGRRRPSPRAPGAASPSSSATKRAPGRAAVRACSGRGPPPRRASAGCRGASSAPRRGRPAPRGGAAARTSTGAGGGSAPPQAASVRSASPASLKTPTAC